jgi:LPPG:FO 2-phospho-L-lactate transferase
MITVLSGGTGTPKLIRGLRQILRDDEITTVVNTADDLWMSGLYVSPDIDTVQYLFAGLLNMDSWWGIRGDSFETFHAMEKLGYTESLPLGDRDRATNVVRSEFLQQGMTLTKATEKIAKAYGVQARILPMSDQEVTTYVKLEEGGLMHYQEYWVNHRGNVPITGIVRRTRDNSPLIATPEVITAINESAGVIIGPSNPVTSIGPIMECTGVREALQNKFTIAVSPFIGNRPISGPAAALMPAWGYAPTSYGTWEVYKDVVNMFIQDNRDTEIEVPGAHRLDTVMTNEKKAESLAWDLLSYFPRK